MNEKNYFETWTQLAEAAKDLPAYRDVFLWMAEKSGEVSEK